MPILPEVESRRRLPGFKLSCRDRRADDIEGWPILDRAAGLNHSALAKTAHRVKARCHAAKSEQRRVAHPANQSILIQWAELKLSVSCVSVIMSTKENGQRTTKKDAVSASRNSTFSNAEPHTVLQFVGRE